MTTDDELGCPETPDRRHVWMTEDCVVWPDKDGRITVCEACGLVDDIEVVT